MALVKYGGGIIQMSGSLAGNTHARNRYGNYIRARTKPINPNTGKQQVVRGLLATLTAVWSQTLTDAQRIAWNLYASSVAMKNKLGETVHLSGFNHYLRSNVALMQAGGARVDAGPTTFELPGKDSTFAIAASEAAQELACTFDDTAEWCDEDAAHLIVYQGQPQNPQRNFFDGPWRIIGSVDGDSGTAPTSTEAIAGAFVFTELQRQWAYARIARADGRLSETFRADCFCAA